MRLNTLCLFCAILGLSLLPGRAVCQTQTEENPPFCPVQAPAVTSYIEGDSSLREAAASSRMHLLGPGEVRFQLPTKPDKVFRRVGKTRLFVPKGQWMLGGSVAFNNHNLKNYQFLVIKDWEGEGYTSNVKAAIGYTIRDNMTVGLKLGYNRTYIDMKSLNLDLGADLTFDVNDLYVVSQMYSGTLFMRNYLSIAQSRRFALFNDVELRYGHGTGKWINGMGDDLTGTYHKISDFEIGFCPGLLVFMNNNVGFEVSAEMLGFQVRHTSQLTNQVETGSRRKTGAKFGVNLFSIKMGATVYFNGRGRNINEKYKDK